MRHIRYLMLLFAFMSTLLSVQAETTLDATNGWTKNDVEAFTELLKKRLSMINQEGNPQLVYSNKVIEEAARKFGGKEVVIWYEQMRLKDPLSCEEQELKKLVETAAYYLLNQSIFDLSTQFLGIKTGWFDRGRTKEYQESLIMQQQHASQLLSHLFYYEMAVQKRVVTKNTQGEDVDVTVMVNVAPFRESLTHLALLMIAVNDKPMTNNERDAAIALIINKVFFQIRMIEQQVSSGLLDEIDELAQLFQLYLPKRAIPWGKLAKFLVVAGATTAVVTLVAGAILGYYSRRMMRSTQAQVNAGVAAVQAAVDARVGVFRGAVVAQAAAFVAGLEGNPHQAVAGVGAGVAVPEVAVAGPAPQAAGIGPVAPGVAGGAAGVNPPAVAVAAGPVPLAARVGALVAGAGRAVVHMPDESPEAREARLRALSIALGIAPAEFNNSFFGWALRNPVAANLTLRSVAVGGRGLAPLFRAVAIPLDGIGAGDQADLARHLGDVATGIVGAAGFAENMLNTRNHQLVNRFYRRVVLPATGAVLVVGGTTAVSYLLPPVLPIVTNSLAAGTLAVAAAIELFPEEGAVVPLEARNLSPFLAGVCAFPSQGILPVMAGAAGSVALELRRPSRLSVLCRRPAHPALAAAVAAGGAGGPAHVVVAAPAVAQGWRVLGWMRALLGRCSARH